MRRNRHGSAFREVAPDSLPAEWPGGRAARGCDPDVFGGRSNCMNAGDIRTLYGQHRWANNRLLEAARLVSPADLTWDLHTSHESLRGTLVHIMWSEWIWLRRWPDLAACSTSG